MNLASEPGRYFRDIYAVIGFVTLSNQPTPLVFMRALPALLVLLLGILLGFGAYRVIKGRK